MRYIYLTLIIVLTAIVLIFTFQNLDLATLKFLNMRIELPISLIVILVYILGMMTGGSLIMLIKNWLNRARIRR
ncbi:hypothetical protein [Natronogracilivirga saccharolytica]|uniref:Lipopolysaccharide assembly protein A domain-containing protein n=1 Tax=Natronogracilivirga saccharolytica TaxID=2812953 RepID=A0A8J7RN11_9BACT|nr:hypothetical protein [Natronogracilivirga saccharolytica]MBP3193038.1 hypothetical protein [Natronogracilivirga saccharolytica]